MSEELVKAYVDGLLQDGFAIDVVGEDFIVIVDPPHTSNVMHARDPKRVANPTTHKDAIILYLKSIGRIV
jgi:hypothetical protein